jgi:hypothetical protein
MRPGRNKWMVWVLGMLASWIQVSGQQGPFLNTEVQPACQGLGNGSIRIMLDQVALTALTEVQFPLVCEVTGDGVEPLALLSFPEDWDFTVDDLAAGDYEMTIYFNAECEYTFSFTVLGSSPYFDDPLIQLTHPSDCSTADGGFRVIASNFVSAYSLLSISYLDKNGQEVNPIPLPGSDLPAGTYTMVGKDALGCEATHDITLYAPYFSELVFDVVPSCPGAQTGFAGVYLRTGEGAYRFDWGDGFTETNTSMQSERADVDPGLYCVTVTSMEDENCQMQGCITVPEYEPYPLQFVYTSTNPCPNMSNGRITLQISGGVEPYIRTFNGQQLNSNALPEGTYLVRVEDHCGQYIEQTVHLQGMTAAAQDIDIIHGCMGAPGQVSLMAEHLSGGTPPYQGLSAFVTFQDTYTVSRDFSFVVRDSRGCEYEVGGGPVTVYNNFARVETKKTCMDLEVGKALIEINASSISTTVLLFDGEDHSGFIDPAQFNQKVILDDLGPGVHTVEVILGECEVTEIANIQIQNGFTQKFNQYDADIDSCLYDEYCADELIKPLSLLKTPDLFPDFGNTSGIGSRCQVNRACPGSGEILEEITVRQRTLPWWQYWFLLTNMLGDNRFSDLIDGYNAGRYSHDSHVGCRLVTFCPLSMQIIGFSSPNILGRKDWINHVDWNQETKEFSYFCLFGSRASFHYENYLNAIFSPSLMALVDNKDLFGDCQLRREKVIQLLEWKNDMMTEYPAYHSGTELAELLDQYEEWKENGHAGTYCSEIVFCLNDFKVINNVFVDSDDCSVEYTCDSAYWVVNIDGDSSMVLSTLSVSSYCRVKDIEDNRFLVCPDRFSNCTDNECNTNPSRPCNKYTLLRDYVPGILEGLTDTLEQMVRIIPPDRNLAFSRLGYHNDERGLSPYAMHRGSESQWIEFFSEYAFEPHYTSIEEEEFMALDMDQESVLYGNMTSTQKAEWSVTYQQQDYLMRAIGTDFIDIQQSFVRDSHLYVIGEFQGQLFFDSLWISQSVSKSYFVVQLGLPGRQVLNHLIIYPGSGFQQAYFDPLSHPEHYLINPYEIDQLLLNGVAMSIDTSSYRFNVFDFQLSAVSAPVYGPEGELLQHAVFSDGIISLYKKEINYSSPDSVQHDGYIYSVVHSGNSLASVTKIYTRSGKAAIWHVPENSSELYLVVHDVDSLVMPHSQTYAYGGKILAFKWESSAPRPVSFYDFQKSLEEGVSIDAIFSTDGALLLAGNLQVDTNFIVVGDVQYLFDEWNGIVQTGFTGMVYKESFEAYPGIMLRPGSSDSSTWTTQIDIRVYPNPMQETAQISLNNPGSERELTIIVQSILGKVCYSRTFELSTGSSAQEIRLDQRFADGVYLLKMYSEEDLIFHSKLIKGQ